MDGKIEDARQDFNAVADHILEPRYYLLRKLAADSSIGEGQEFTAEIAEHADTAVLEYYHDSLVGGTAGMSSSASPCGRNFRGPLHASPLSLIVMKGDPLMDVKILRLIAAELNDILPGMFVNKIHQPLPREIVLRLRGRQGGERKLIISADPLRGRIHLTGLKVPNPPAPPRFCAYLRAHFQGSRVVCVSAAEDDRVVRIDAVRGPGPEIQQTALILELLGRDSNILLVDRSTNLIKDCLHHIPEKESATRAVLPGREYLPPPKRDRSTPAPSAPEPGTRQGKRSLAPPAALSEDRVAGMNEAAEAFYRPMLEGGLIEAFRRTITAPLKKAIRSLERRTDKVQADIARLKAFADVQHHGDLLKGNLRGIAKGMKRIEVRDWETDEPVTIVLDPALSGVENMARIFKKAAKGKRGIQRALSRMDETRHEKKALEDLLYYAETARDLDELESIRGDTSVPASRQGSKRPDSRKQDTSGPHRVYLEFRSPSGHTVLVGKSGKGNDFLLRNKSRPGDLWFHAKDIPGAHVILLQRGINQPAPGDVEFAGGLAVHFSRAGTKGKIDVMVADVKDVHRPKGAVPGMVIVKGFRTMRSEGIDPAGE